MWTIPDKGTPQNDLQSILFSEYLNVLSECIAGNNVVLSGLACTAQGSPDMTVAVAKGAVLSNGTMFAVAAGNATITTANATNPRLDLVVITSAGAIAVRAGTAAAAPKPPSRTSNDVVLAVVYVPATDTTISSDQITDLRIPSAAPVILKKVTTAVATNTTTGAITIFTATIPSGLFLAGKMLRLRVHGNYLFNSGSPTFTLAVSYGGTTMFADTSVAATAGAVRGAWTLDCDLIAQANASQVVGGAFIVTPPTARTAATTGIGELAAAGATAAFAGTAAVDSDAGDRVFLATITMNVSNVADEIRIEGATLELL
jgi:hypothetical protein